MSSPNTLLPPALLKAKGKSEALRLSDAYGSWCVWCLRYIDRLEELELHHVFSRAQTSRVFEPFGFVDGWRVPVHRGCHREIQEHSDSAALRFTEAARKSIFYLQESARDAFFTGELSRGLLMLEVAQRRITSDSADQVGDERSNLIHLFNSAAGSVLVTKLVDSHQSVAAQWKDRLEAGPRGRAVRSDQSNFPFWRFYGADIYANAGKYCFAKDIIHEVETSAPRFPRHRYSAWGALARRKGLLLADRRSANEAANAALTKCDWYNYRTALLGRGWASFAERDMVKAFDDFSLVGDNPDTFRLSLWHRFCSDFGKGAAFIHLNRHALDRSLGFLLHAQYLSALFGLQGNPVPDPREPGAVAPAFVSPTDMVLWVCQRFEKELPPNKLLELRDQYLLPTRPGLLSLLAHGVANAE